MNWRKQPRPNQFLFTTLPPQTPQHNNANETSKSTKNEKFTIVFRGIANDLEKTIPVGPTRLRISISSTLVFCANSRYSSVL